VGQQAFGYSSIKDAEGAIKVALKCEKCYEAYVARRGAEAVVCNDCKMHVPRSFTQRYVPYKRDGLSEEEAELIICGRCWEDEAHRARLAQDDVDQMEDTQGDINLLDPGLGRECSEEAVPPEDFVECSDCGAEFHPGQMLRYIPPDRGAMQASEATLCLCPECATSQQHEARIEAGRQHILEKRGY